MVASEVSLEKHFALMPHQTLDKVVSEPNYSQMKKWRKQMSANLISVKTPTDWGRGKCHLGILQDPAVFLARNGDPYNPPLVEPPEYPAIPQKSATAAREQLRAANEVATINWERYQHTQHIVVNIGAAAFEPFVIGELDDPDEGLNAVDIRALYKYLMDRFAKISQTKID